MLLVVVAHESEGWQNLHFFHPKCLPQQLLSSTIVVYVETQPVVALRCVITSSVTVKMNFSDCTSLKSKFFLPRLPVCSQLYDQKSLDSFGKISRRDSALVQGQNCPKRARETVHTSLFPCRALFSSHYNSHKPIQSFSFHFVVPKTVSFLRRLELVYP